MGWWLRLQFRSLAWFVKLTDWIVGRSTTWCLCIEALSHLVRRHSLLGELLDRLPAF